MGIGEYFEAIGVVWPWIIPAGAAGYGLRHYLRPQEQTISDRVTKLKRLHEADRLEWDATLRDTQERLQKAQNRAKETEARLAQERESMGHRLTARETDFERILSEKDARISQTLAELAAQKAEVRDLKHQLQTLQTQLSTPILGTNANTTRRTAPLAPPTPIENIAVASNTPPPAVAPETPPATQTTEITERLAQPAPQPVSTLAAAPIAVAPLSVAAPENDDLTLIPGIGTVMAKMLHSMGIRNYRQIGMWTVDEMMRVDRRFDFQGRIKRENWVESARELHYQKYGERL